MKKKLLTTALLAATLSSGSAYAGSNKLLIVGGVDMAFKDVGLSVNNDQSVAITTVKPNVTAAYGNYYANIAYDHAIAPGIGTVVESGTPYLQNYLRSDYLFTFGYRLTQSLNLFVGWINGYIKVISTGDVPSGTSYVTEVKTIDYERKGPFLGAAYSIAYGNKGTLNISAAFAAMKGSIQETRSTISSGTTITQDGSFPTGGFSLNLAWTGPLTRSLSYRVGINQTIYRSGQFGTAPNTTTATERYSSLYFGVTNYF